MGKLLCAVEVSTSGKASPGVVTARVIRVKKEDSKARPNIPLSSNPYKNPLKNHPLRGLDPKNHNLSMLLLYNPMGFLCASLSQQGIPLFRSRRMREFLKKWPSEKNLQ